MLGNRRLKSWVQVSVLVLVVIGVIGVTSYISKEILLSLQVDNNSYVLRDIVETPIVVNNEVKQVIERPFNDENVSVHINYYDVESSKEDQERSLILYEKTYMPNTGILYGSESIFDVMCVYEGTVENIENNEIFGNIITIKHNNDLISKYSSLSNTTVAVGDTVNAGEIIGQSGSNKVVSESQNMLLFELIYNGTNVNPEKYYEQEIEEMR